MSIIKILTILALGAGVTTAASAYEGSVSADYTSAFVSDDPILTFGVRAQHTLPYDLKLSIAQSINNNLVVDDSKDPWEWNDTVLALSKSHEYSGSVVMGARLSVTLPTSIESRYYELRSRPELRLSATVKLPYGLTSVTGVSAAYYWYKYDSSKPEGQTSGGQALSDYTYSIGQSLGVNFLDDFSSTLNGSYRVRHYYDLKQTESYIAAENQTETYGYSLGLTVGYTYEEETSLSVTAEQGSSLERPGYDDFVIFDKEQTTWTISLLRLF